MNTTLVFNNFGGPDQQSLTELGMPQPGAGEIAIEVKAAAVNPVDWKIREGLLGTNAPLPSPMGREASGVVTAVGVGVTGFAPGDEVFGLVAAGHGAFARHTVLNVEQSLAKPEEISHEDAATIPVAAATAYDVTHGIELEAGQTLLIVGAGGGIGLMAAQIGRVHKFNVVGVANEAKRALVEATGATFVASGAGVLDRVRAVAPDGVDLLVDLVGGDALRDVAAAAKDPSRIVSSADSVTVRQLGGQAVQRTTVGMGKITDVIKYGLVDPGVSARYRLEDAADAIAAVEGGHAAGKVVITP